MTLSAREAEMIGWLETQYDAMVGLLGRLVDTDSGSYDRDGVARAGALIRDHLHARGIACAEIVQADGSVSIKATVPAGEPGADRAHALLLGHRDTVFPRGVLEAFARLGGAAHAVVNLVTSDEEIASPASRPAIEAAARGARAVFNAEPGRPSGALVTGRKGALFLTIEVTGRAAHSGGAHEQGISAIEELCRKVLDLHALTDYASGTTANVGLIQGGQSVNTVAPLATAEVDVRFRTIAAMRAAEAALSAILERTWLPGTTTRITRRAAFLPLEQTAASQALFEHYVACAAELGLTTTGEYTGGSADSGFTAALGAPTLCGTGPLGAKAHSPDEVCHLDTLVPRAQALALAIARLPA
jgi:glutamate carboxypeptidase